MTGTDKDIDAMMAEAEEYILRIGRGLIFPQMDQDDVYQELRIHALNAARKHDPSTGVEWAKYLCLTLKMRKIDMMRTHANLDRSGKNRHRQHRTIDYGGSGDSPKDAIASRECWMASTEWRDVLEAAMRDSRETYAVALRLSGESLRETGKKVGRTEWWACQSMKNGLLVRTAVGRIRELMGVA